jgi:hypothetical protein
MGISAGPNSISDNLAFHIDPANPRSYAGVGTVIYDLSGNGKTSYFTNGAFYQNYSKGVIVVDGNNDYISTPIFNLTSPVTVSAWVKNVTGEGGVMGAAGPGIGYGNGEVLLYFSGKSILIQGANSGSKYYQFPQLNLNEWVNLTMTRDVGNNMQVYLNGIGSTSNPQSHSNTIQMNQIGRYSSFTNQYNAKGSIGEVRIYNKALSASEVFQNYNASKKRYITDENYVTSNLILHLDAANSLSYPGTGSTWYDLSGFGHSCGLINGPTFKPIKGGVISFDGSNDRAVVTRDTTKPLFTNSDFTLHCIFKYKNIDNSLHRIAGFADIENCLDCWITTNGTPTYLGQNIRSCFDDDSSGSRVFSTGTFEHIEFVDLVYSSTSSGKKLYINGGLNRTALTQSPVTSNYSFYIGSQESGSYVTNMEISLLQVYNRELTQAEVTQNYNAFRNRFEKPSAISDSLLLDFDFAKQYSYTGTGNTMYNLSGLGYTATLLNSPTYSSASPGYMSFDGTNDYVESSTFSGVGNTYFTLNIWFYKPTSWANAYRKLAIIGTGHFTSLYMSEGPGPVFYFGIGLSGSGQIGPETTKMPAVDQWHMATGTWDGSNVKLYIDGALISSVTGSGSYPSTWDTSTFKIGYGYGSEYFTGYISQVQLYNRALSATEVMQNFNAMRERYNI